MNVSSARGLEIVLVYDCRYPDSLGGAERWLGALARELARRGATVTYIHGARRGVAESEGVRWVGLMDRSHLYTGAGVRRMVPAALFAWHLAGHLRKYRTADLVYVHDMPILPVFAAAWTLRGRRTRWVVEWIEWWDAAYWRGYAGTVTGTIGYLLQRWALRLSPVAVCSTRTVAAMLTSARPGMPVIRLPGLATLHAADVAPAAAARGPGVRAVYLGRLVPHKGALLAVAAMAAAAARYPLTGLVIGSGPEAASVHAEIARLGMTGVIEVLSDADDERVRAELRRADVLIHPSVREGFGLVVVEANAQGVPVVLLAAPDNAAVELLGPDGAGGVAVPWTGRADDDVRSLTAGVATVLAAGAAGRAAALVNARRLATTATVERSAEMIWRLATRRQLLPLPPSRPSGSRVKSRQDSARTPDRSNDSPPP